MPKGYEHLAPPPPPPSSNNPPPSPSSSSSSGGGGSSSGGDKGGIILVFMFVGSVALMIAVVFTLNMYLLAIGGIMFLISIVGLSWGQPSRHQRGRYGGYGTYTYGSYNAKRNMYRGHRYSKKR